MKPQHITNKQTAAQAIVNCMKIEKVRHVFCVPGESYLPILDALYDSPTIDVISARHEGGAAFMAEGYAKSTLKPGIVLATRGVGAANLSIGVHTAYQDSTPLIVFLGQVHRKFRGREAFQEVDLEQFFQPISKWVVEVKDPERMPEIVQKAFRIAQSGRPGPVIISIPEDVLPIKAEMYFGPSVKKPNPVPAQAEVKAAEELLLKAKRPLIIAGGGVKSARAERALLTFAEKHKLPVMAAFRRHDVFPNDHPLYVGHLGLGMAKEIRETVAQSDLIVACGTRLSEVTTQDYSIITAEKKLLQIDIDVATLGNVYAPDLGIVADLREALEAFTFNRGDRGWGDWVSKCRQRYEEASCLVYQPTDVLNKQVIAILQDNLPAEATITNDAGNFAGWLHTFFSFTKAHSYVGPTSGAMGYGMPAAIGAKLAFPHKTVVSLSGDGGFMMTAQELETAVRYEIPIISLVFNNQMYGTIRMHQEMDYPNKVMATDLGNVSFVDLAKALGADGHLVHTAEEFRQAFKWALTMKRPVVIEIQTEQEHIAVGTTIDQLRKQKGE